MLCLPNAMVGTMLGALSGSGNISKVAQQPRIVAPKGVSVRWKLTPDDGIGVQVGVHIPPKRNFPSVSEKPFGRRVPVCTAGDGQPHMLRA